MCTCFPLKRRLNTSVFDRSQSDVFIDGNGEPAHGKIKGSCKQLTLAAFDERATPRMQMWCSSFFLYAGDSLHRAAFTASKSTFVPFKTPLKRRTQRDA